jgi:hypothetical protein
MAEDAIPPEPEQCRHFERERRERPMSDGKDARKESVKNAGPYAVGDRRRADARGKQLFSPDQSALSLRRRSNRARPLPIHLQNVENLDVRQRFSAIRTPYS